MNDRVRITEGYISKRRPPLNLAARDRGLFEHELRKTIPDAELVLIRDAHILDDVVLTTYAPFTYDRLTYATPTGMKAAARSSLHYLARLRLAAKRPRKVEEALWITDRVAGGYFHWFADALCRLNAARKEKPRIPFMLSEELATCAYVRGSLELLGEHDLVTYRPEEHVLVRSLWVPQHLARTGNFNDPVLRDLQKRFEDPLSTGADGRVFVSRSKAPTRRILNDTEVVAIMRDHGVAVVHMEDLTFEEQVALMRRTRTLIGTHGAGLTNMLFMPPGGQILEIRAAGDAHNNCYFTMASALDHTYRYVLGEANHPLTQLADLHVDPEALDAAMRIMLH